MKEAERAKGYAWRKVMHEFGKAHMRLGQIEEARACFEEVWADARLEAAHGRD